MIHGIERVSVFSETGISHGATRKADKLLGLVHRGGLIGLVIGVIFRLRYTATEEQTPGNANLYSIYNLFSAITMRLKRNGLVLSGVSGLNLIRRYLLSHSSPFNAGIITTGYSSGGASATTDLELPFIFARKFWGRERGSLEGAQPLDEFRDGEITVQIGSEIGTAWNFNGSGCQLDIDLVVAWSDRAPMPVFTEFHQHQESLPTLVLRTHRGYSHRLRGLYVADDAVADFSAAGVTGMSLLLDSQYMLVAKNGADHQAMLRMASGGWVHKYLALEAATAPSDLPTIMEIVPFDDSGREAPVIEQQAKIEAGNGNHSGAYVACYDLQWRPDGNTTVAMLREMGVSEETISRALAEESDARNEAVLWAGDVPVQIQRPAEFEAAIDASVPAATR